MSAQCAVGEAETRRTSHPKRARVPLQGTLATIEDAEEISSDVISAETSDLRSAGVATIEAADRSESPLRAWGAAPSLTNPRLRASLLTHRSSSSTEKGCRGNGYFKQKLQTPWRRSNYSLVVCARSTICCAITRNCSFILWMQSIFVASPCTISSANVRHVGLPQLPQSNPGSSL